MGLFDDVLRQSRQIADTSKQKMKQLNMEQALKANQDQINDRLMLLGASVYDNLTKGNELGAYEAEIAEITSLYARQVEIQKEVVILTETSATCPSCGEMVDVNSNFCPHCGAKR